MAHHSYWARPATEELPKEAWNDPSAEEKGVLSAQRIVDYVKACNLIDPFDRAHLRPAGYDLTLGPICQMRGKDILLTEDEPRLTIPPNGLAFVSVREVLRVPHFMIARFNISIDLAYRGVLLGTGPHVDPGFQGVLSCPLHNLSSEPIHLTLGQSVAFIDFVKTTGLALPESILAAKNENDLYEAVQREAAPRPVLYRKEGRWRRPITGYQKGTPPTSSLVELESKVNRTRINVRVGAAAAAATFLLTLVGAFIGLIGPIQTDTRDVGDQRTTVTQQGSAIRAIEACLQALKSQPTAGHPSPSLSVPTACENLPQVP